MGMERGHEWVEVEVGVGVRVRGRHVSPPGFSSPEPGRGEHQEAAILKAQGMGLIVRW